MGASLKIIARNEMKIEFTPEDIAALKDMPGISLGHLMCKRERLEKLFKFKSYPTQYKNGFIDRMFEIHYVAKLLLHGTEQLEDRSEETFSDNTLTELKNKEIWSWIWHILKDEYKFNHFIINILTGEISIDIDNAAGCKPN